MSIVVLDTVTGSIIREINPGDKIVTKAQSDFVKEQEHAPKSETFSKIYHACVPILAECNLNGSEHIVFIHLATNIRYQSNVAKYSNGKLITRHNLMSDLKMPEPTLLRAVRGLIKHGLIVEVMSTEGKVFIVNPFIVSVGDTMSKTVYDLFRKTKWARW